MGLAGITNFLLNFFLNSCPYSFFKTEVLFFGGEGRVGWGVKVFGCKMVISVFEQKRVQDGD